MFHVLNNKGRYSFLSPFLVECFFSKLLLQCVSLYHCHHSDSQRTLTFLLHISVKRHLCNFAKNDSFGIEPVRANSFHHFLSFSPSTNISISLYPISLPLSVFFSLKQHHIWGLLPCPPNTNFLHTNSVFCKDIF